MTYAEKLKFLNDHVKMPGACVEGEDLMRLISLVCRCTMDYREKHRVAGKDPKKVTPMIILVNAAGKPTSESDFANQIYESVSLHCDLLISHDAKFDNYGAPDAKTMMAEIKRTIDQWLPF